jgi:cell wall-associated NlpC family hydrolase
MMNNQNTVIPTDQVEAWTSVSERPINQALLEGAKALLKAVYTYKADAPDFLPSSYSDLKDKLSRYVLHASQTTRVSWMDQGNGLTWTCDPTRHDDQLVPFSGTVQSVETGADTTQCFTDCSGFITSLFAYVNKITGLTTKFDSWEAGKVVPEAGCFDMTDHPNCDHPNPSNYYRFITQPDQGGQFVAVNLDNLEPGDLLVYANPSKNAAGGYNDTGHIMLVTAVMDAPDNTQPNLTVKHVVVIDETGSPHTDDTRHVTREGQEKIGTGIGMGIVKLTSMGSGPIDFYWSVGNTKAEPGNIALGRAL